MEVKFKLNEKIVLLLLSLLTFIPYSQIIKGFFQQDEWYGFGQYFLHKNLSFIDSLKYIFAPSVGHYNPFTVGLQNILFSWWGLSYSKYAIFAIILHLSVTLSVYFLAKIIFMEDKLLAFAAALLFGIFAASYQATAWAVIDIAIGTSSLLGVVSAILFFKFIKTNKDKYIGWSLAILILSLLFKEITIGLLPLFFVLCLIFKKKTKYLNLIIGITAGYFLFRVLMILIPSTSGDKLVTASQSLSNIIYNFVTVPLKTIVQTIVTPDLMKIISFAIARIFPVKVSGIPGSPLFETFAIEKVMEYLTMFIAFVIIIFGLWRYLKVRKTKYGPIILVGIFWAIFNSFIFSFAPESSRVISLVDSRNLYFTSIGISIFIVINLHLFFQSQTKKFFIFLIVIIIFNIFWLNTNLTNFVNVGLVRKNIIERITYLYPKLPRQVVFYTESDTSYYGLPDDEKILPFQSGMGQTLLVWYYPIEQFSVNFFKDRFLWDLKSQDYRQIDVRGFGYFRDYKLLQEAHKQYNFPIDSVIAFKWSHFTNSLTDITTEVRNKLKNEVKK